MVARTLKEKQLEQDELNEIVVDIRTSFEMMEDHIRLHSSKTRIRQVAELRKIVEMFLAEMEVFM